MKPTETLSASHQCYLATIYVLEIEREHARAGEIALKCRVHKSSVTAALRALAERSLIHYEPYGTVTLSTDGRQLAECVVRKCHILRDFLVRTLGLDESVAEKAARKMQHSVPPLVAERISEFLESEETTKRGEAGHCDNR